jgi:ferredoxin
MRIEVDLTRCTGTANCVVAAPDVFELAEDADQVQLLVAELSPERRDAVENAVRMCPQAALQLVP